MADVRVEAVEKLTYGMTLKELRAEVRTRARCAPVEYACRTLTDLWLVAMEVTKMPIADIRVVVSRTLFIIDEALRILVRLEPEEGEEEAVLPRRVSVSDEDDEETERIQNGGYTIEELKTKVYVLYDWHDPVSLLNLARCILISVEEVLNEIIDEDPTEENMEQLVDRMSHAVVALLDAVDILQP